MSQIKTTLFSDEEMDKIKKLYRTFAFNYLRTTPGNTVLPKAYEKFTGYFKEWQVRCDDVYVMAFPKTGTTWTQELVWCVQNDCNFDGARAIPLVQRVPYLEMPVLLDQLPRDGTGLMPTADLLAIMENMPSPRMLKSHMPFHLLPDDILDKSKAVLCIRNPKDTVVSYFRWEQEMRPHSYVGDFAAYFNLFMDGMVLYGPYFEYVVEAWKKRDHPNLCLLSYEDMKKDQAGSVRKVAKFLGKDLSDDQVESLVEHLSFNKMKNNEAVNGAVLRDTLALFTEKGGFVRKGQVGDWKNYFTEEMNLRMDKAIEKCFKPIGLEFIYEL